MQGALLMLAIVLLSPPAAAAQDAVVEWMEFDCPDGRCLVLNAYEHESPESLVVVADSADEPHRAQLPTPAMDEDDIAALVVELPVRLVPPESALKPFLARLGLADLQDLLEDAPDLAAQAPGTSGFALWRMLLIELRAQPHLRIGDRRIFISEVSADRQRVYAGQRVPSRENPILPHLTRGVVAVRDGDESVSASAPVIEFDGIEYGTYYYAAVRLVNLGSRPARVFPAGGWFAGARVDDKAFSIDPGEEVSRLYRYEAGPASLLQRRSSVLIAYESRGERGTVLRLDGVRSKSVLYSFASSIEAQLTAHAGYWREMPFYRYTLLAVAAGGLLLLLVVGRNLLTAARSEEASASLARMTELVGRQRAAVARVAAKAGEYGARLRQTGTRLDGLRKKAMTRPSRPTTNGTHTGTKLKDDLVDLCSHVSGRFSRLREQVDERRRSAAIPMDPRAAIERLGTLSSGLATASAEADAYASLTSELRREAARLARKLDSDLRKGRLARSVEHFQILWALRLLAAVLARTDSDPRSVMDQWLSGTRKVLDHECVEAVGPTNWEYMALVRELEA